MILALCRPAASQGPVEHDGGETNREGERGASSRFSQLPYGDQEAAATALGSRDVRDSVGLGGR